MGSKAIISEPAAMMIAIAAAVVGSMTSKRLLPAYFLISNLINWGVGIIVSLIGLVGWLLAQYVLK